MTDNQKGKGMGKLQQGKEEENIGDRVSNGGPRA